MATRPAKGQVSTQPGPAAAPDAPSRQEVEEALDDVVPDVISCFEGKDVIGGWHLLPSLHVEQREIGSAAIPTLSEAQAERLVKLAQTDPHAFDLASYIAGASVVAISVTGGASLSPPLRLFVAQVLMGEARRPSQRGRPRAKDTALRVFQYALCRFMAERAALQLTRNQASRSETFTACDAVAEAFARAGMHKTYEQMASLCYDKAHGDIRALAEYLDLTGLGADDF